MKNHIKIVSRASFAQLAKDKFPDGVLPPDLAVISIHEPKNKVMTGYSEAWPAIMPDADNVLNLWFNDAEWPMPEVEAILFDQNMAKQVINFAKKNADKKHWILHCTMGVSRSGAVGSFLADFFDINYLEFKRDNPQIEPNSLVKSVLKKTFDNYDSEE